MSRVAERRDSRLSERQGIALICVAAFVSAFVGLRLTGDDGFWVQAAVQCVLMLTIMWGFTLLHRLWVARR